MSTVSTSDGTVNYSRVFFCKKTLEDLSALWSADEICANGFARGISDLNMAFQESIASHLKGGYLREYLEGAGSLQIALARFDSDKSRSAVLAESIRCADKNISAENRTFFSIQVTQLLGAVPLRLPGNPNDVVTLQMLDKMGQISGCDFLSNLAIETYGKMFEMIEANILWQSEDNPLNQYAESVFLKLKHECALAVDNLPHAASLSLAATKQKRCRFEDADAADAQDDRAEEAALGEFPDLLAKLTFQRWLYRMEFAGQNFGSQNGAVLHLTLAFAQSCYLKERHEDSLAFLMQALEFSVSRQLSVRVQKIKMEIYLLLIKVLSRLHAPPLTTSMLCLASALRHSVQDDVQILLAGQTIAHGYGWFDVEGFLFLKLDEMMEPQTSFFKFKSRLVHAESLIELTENCIFGCIARRLFHRGCEMGKGMDANDSAAFVADKHLRRLRVTLLETKAMYIDRKWMRKWELLMEKTDLLRMLLEGLTSRNVRSRPSIARASCFAVMPSKDPLLDAFYSYFRGEKPTSTYIFKVQNEIEIQTRDKRLENSAWKCKTLATQFLLSLAVSFDEKTPIFGQAWIDEACAISNRHLPGYYRTGLLEFVRDTCSGKTSCTETVDEENSNPDIEVAIIRTIHKPCPKLDIARKNDVQEFMALLNNPAVPFLHDDVLLRRLAEDVDVREALSRYDRRRPVMPRPLRRF